MQASWGKLALAFVSEAVNIVVHLSQWLPHLNLQSVLRSWMFVMSPRCSSEMQSPLEEEYASV